MKEEAEKENSHSKRQGRGGRVLVIRDDAKEDRETLRGKIKRKEMRRSGASDPGSKNPEEGF